MIQLLTHSKTIRLPQLSNAEIGIKVLENIKKEISAAHYQRYFKNIIFNKEKTTDNAFYYIVPNIFILKWITTKYKDILKDNIHSFTKSSPSIFFALKGQEDEINIVEKTKNNTIKNNSSLIINPSFTFDSFVVGTSNTFAFASSKNVGMSPGTTYNPLFIHGETGLGKTHLVQAIGNLNIDSDLKILYTTTEQLMNDFTKHITSQSMNLFKEKYRNCDMLLIDDVQFLSGKEIFQEEFFHTFNELYSKKKQIVLTSDKKPSEIIGLEDRLKSRFEWGLVTSIGAPDLNTKIGIIKKKCEIDRISLTNDIIMYIAANLETNIREIEGILIKINAYANLINIEEINIDFVKNILKEHIKEKKENIDIDQIMNAVARELNVKPSEIKSKQRNRIVVRARRIVIYLAREMTQNSMPFLAKYFNMKDHSAISHNIKKIKNEIDKNLNEKYIIESVRRKVLNDIL